VAYANLDTTYTPLSASSTLEITLSLPLLAHSAASNSIRVAIFRDAGANAVFATLSPTVAGANGLTSLHCTVRVPSTATSATTFKMRWGVGAGTGYINRLATADVFGGVVKATMTVKEIV
jgi:hypothetical protein